MRPLSKRNSADDWRNFPEGSAQAPALFFEFLVKVFVVFRISGEHTFYDGLELDKPLTVGVLGMEPVVEEQGFAPSTFPEEASVLELGQIVVREVFEFFSEDHGR